MVVSQEASLSTKPYFVAIAGNIGCGKTTLTQLLATRLNWQAHHEEVTNNPYLADFYQDMHRWSFPLQVFFLNTRFKAHQAIQRNKYSAIQDRSLYEDAHIFARNLYDSGHIEERDYQNYLELYRSMVGLLNPPDLIVYLRKSLPQLKSQIAKRGRSYESAIPDEYLVSLERHYDDWFDRYDLGKKVRIDSDDLDFVARPDDFEQILSQIQISLAPIGAKAMESFETKMTRHSAQRTENPQWIEISR